jgi:hypothetical protein
MMRFPEFYSGEIMWDMLKSAIYNASEEQGYTLRSIQGDKSTVLTKSAKSGIPVSGWTYSLGFIRNRLYQIRQTMHSFLKGGGNDLFAQGNKSTLMKGNRNIEKRGPLGKTLPRKTTTILPVVSQQRCPLVSIFTILNQMDTIIFQQMSMLRTSKRALFVHITIMKDKRLCPASVLPWTKVWRKW